jgi:hypothetical protein
MLCVAKKEHAILLPKIMRRLGVPVGSGRIRASEDCDRCPCILLRSNSETAAARYKGSNMKQSFTAAMKRSYIYIGAAVGVLIAIAVVLNLARQSNADPISNIYSADCEEWQFGLYGDNGSITCEEPRSCTTTADCDYLLIETLPPRVGSCEAGRCVAYCGSGVLRRCR